MNTQYVSQEFNRLESDDMQTVLVVEDASEAIAAMDAEGPVNLVFSDVRMPGKMDGFDLANWFQTHYPEVPVLLTSGYNGGRNLAAESIPGVRFIEKPYSQSQVARRIRALLGA